MITLKRALKSLIRQPLKSTLLLIILLVLLNAMAASIAIREESHQAIRRIDEGLGRIVTFDNDVEAASKLFRELDAHVNNPESPFADDIYTDSEGNNILLGARNRQKDIDRVVTMGSSPLVESFSFSLRPSGRFELPYLQLSGTAEFVESIGHNQQSPYLIGAQRTPLLETEHSDAFITNGRQFTEEEMKTGAPSCIISKEFAELNHLEPGDTVHGVLYPLNMYTGDYYDSSIFLKLEIVGIIDYQKKIDLDADPAMFYQDPITKTMAFLYNEIIVPNALVLELQRDLHKLQMQEDYLEDFPPQPIPYVKKPFFVLKDPSDIPTFKAEYQHLLDEDLKMFLDNRYRYDLLTAPLESASKLADNALLFSILAAVLVATLVLFFYLRERRYEIGILLSLGLKKRQLVIQLLIEVLIVTVIALGITTFTGQAIGTYITEVSIRDTLQENKSALEITRFDEQYKFEAYTMDFAEKFITPEEVNEQYQVGFSAGYMLWLTLGALITAVLATLFSSYYIYSYSPRKILLQ